VKIKQEWIKGKEGENFKFLRERFLNDSLNRWGLNKASVVGPTSELIRQCSPKAFEEWERYYFANARQKKKDGIQITKEYLKGVGGKLYNNISKVVRSEITAITEEECVAYVYNLVLNRTYEGYQTEIKTIYGQLERELQVKIEPAPDKWDRSYNVDFFIKIENRDKLNQYAGIQIKSVNQEIPYLQIIREKDLQRKAHEKFTKKFGGKVFYVFSSKVGDRKVIRNKEVIDEIKQEIEKLKK
jgi:hypothetical protein